MTDNKNTVANMKINAMVNMKRKKGVDDEDQKYKRKCFGEFYLLFRERKMIFICFSWLRFVGIQKEKKSSTIIVYQSKFSNTN